MVPSGWIRGLISKQYETERFVRIVAESMHKQVQTVNEQASLKLWQSTENEADIYLWELVWGDENYRLITDYQQVNDLQNKSPFSLDRFIWKHFAAEGLKIPYETQSYFQFVLS